MASAGGKHVIDRGAFAALLRRYRVAANLTQEELAERSGMSLSAISALERGDRRSPRPSTIGFLAEALMLHASQREALVAAARGQVLPVAPDPRQETSLDLAEALTHLASLPTDAVPDRALLPTGSRMPFAPNPLFVGRSEELLQLASTLKAGDTTVALGQIVASTGLGGLGKTQLAVEFVHRYGRYFAGGVFWLSFASADEVPLQVAGCAGPDFEARPLEERVQRVRDAWQAAVPRLLVFDNCEEEALLQAWRPSSGGCRVLVTSRRSHWSPTLGVTALPLDLLPRPDSIELLCRYCPGLAADDPALDTMVDELGDLPLALHLAGSYLRAYRSEVGLDDYLAELRRAEVVQHASLLGTGLDDSVSPTGHVLGVAQTFALCLGRLDREREVDRVAIALLDRMACMAPGEPVPRDLLAKTLEDVDPLLRADGLRRLGSVGLVEEGGATLRLHRLLVHFVRQALRSGGAKAAVDRALICCGDAARDGVLLGPALAVTIPHLVHAAGSDLDDAPRLAALCRSTGLAVQVAGDIRAARCWFERARTIREETLGEDHPDTLTSVDDLAEQLRMQGELAEARALQERALAARERVLGPNHPDTAQSANNLAIVLWPLGELNAARYLLERTMAITERVAGPLAPDTAVCLHNLAGVLLEQGELSAAQLLEERAVHICERVYGPDHLFTSNAINSLARLHQARDDLTGARRLFERALAIRERVGGPHHPQTAGSLHNLAMLLVKQDDRTAARPLFERALAIRERVLGPNHPDTVATRRALAEMAAEEGGGPAAGG